MHPHSPLVPLVLGTCLLLSGGLGANTLPTSQFFATPTEIQGYADLNGDGQADLVLLDRATGAIRIGFSNPAGGMDWSPVRPTGVYDVTAATAGRIQFSTRDSLILTSPLSNHLVYLTQTSAAAVPAISRIKPANFGPLSLAAGKMNGSAGNEDLLLLYDRSTGGAVHSAQLHVLNVVGEVLSSTLLTQQAAPVDQAARIRTATGAANQVAYVNWTGGSGTLSVLALGTAGQPVVGTLSGMAPNSRYLLHPFAGSAAEPVTWIPGSSTLTTWATSATGWNNPTARPTPFPLGMVVGIPTATGARLLLMSEDGRNAAIWDSPTGPSRQDMTAPEGLFYTGASMALASTGRFQLLLGPEPWGRTSTVRSFLYRSDSDQHQLTGDESLMPVHDTSGAGNVLVYAGEPFVAPNARVLGRLRAGDWSTTPVFGGTMQVTRQSYLGPTAGLGSANLQNLGAPPPGATHLQVNQVNPAISVFPLSPASGTALEQVSIFPTPGVYPSAVQVVLSAPVGWAIRYRTRPDEPWRNYAGPFFIHRTSTVEAMANIGIIARTEIATSHFEIPTPAGELSTLKDGIPDYVKIGRNFDPTQLPDRSADTNDQGSYNYLQILMEGQGISSAVLAGTALNLHVRPHSHNGLATTTTPAMRVGLSLPDATLNPGVRVEARDFSGEILDSALGNSWVVFGANQTAAELRNIGLAGRASLMVISTTPNFALTSTPPYDAGTFFQGRELIGLAALPAASPAVYQRTYTGGDDAAEAAAWIAGATAFYAAQSIPNLALTLDPLETTAALIFEMWVGRAMVERGLLPASYSPTGQAAELPANRVSLTPFRRGEGALLMPDSGTPAGVLQISPELISELESFRSDSDPGFALDAVAANIRDGLRNLPVAQIAALRAVTLDIYRISARWGGLLPGAFPSPVDALRLFVYTGQPPRAFTNDWEDGLPAIVDGSLTSLNAATYTSAAQGIQLLLGSPTSRPVQDFSLRVLPNTLATACTVLERTDTGDLVALVNESREPFRFPATFRILPGTVISVTAYTDLLPTACAPATLEVVQLDDRFRAFLTEVPFASPSDLDGNLLSDEWEMLFLGSTGNDPLFIINNDGYSLMQIFLSGGDPIHPASYNYLPPVDLSPPHLQLQPWSGDSVMLTWDFPAAFADFFEFSLQENSDLGPNWDSLNSTPAYLGDNQFYMTVPEPAPSSSTDPRFWRFQLRLR